MGIYSVIISWEKPCFWHFWTLVGADKPKESPEIDLKIETNAASRASEGSTGLVYPRQGYRVT